MPVPVQVKCPHCGSPNHTHHSQQNHQAFTPQALPVTEQQVTSQPGPSPNIQPQQLNNTIQPALHKQLGSSQPLTEATQDINQSVLLQSEPVATEVDKGTQLFAE